MTTSVLRTADAWWVQTPTGAARIATAATTTGELLADRRSHRRRGEHGSDTVPVDSLDAGARPVTAPCRVVAQMTNYALARHGPGHGPGRRSR